MSASAVAVSNGKLSVVIDSPARAIERVSEEEDLKINALFFPEDSQESSAPFAYSFLCLSYLASLGARGKSPLTSRQYAVLQASVNEECRSYWGLRLGVAASAVATLAIAYLGFAINNDSSTGLKAGIFTLAGVISTILVCLSWWGTGFAPKTSSDARDSKQDSLSEMQDHYKDLAFALIRLYYSHRQEEVSHIANSIAQADLRGIVAQAIDNRVRAGQIVDVLLQAVTFVVSKGKELPRNAQLLTNIEMCQLISRADKAD